MELQVGHGGEWRTTCAFTMVAIAMDEEHGIYL